LFITFSFFFSPNLFFGLEFFELLQKRPGGEGAFDYEQLSAHVAAVEVLQVLEVGVQVDEVDAGKKGILLHALAAWHSRHRIRLKEDPI
jgi:hypothetical protein